MQPTLQESVARLANIPTAVNREAFYLALISAEVSFTSSSAHGVGNHIVQEGDKVTIPLANGPDGTPMLFVYSDRASIVALRPKESVFTAITGKSLLEIAAMMKVGVIVQCYHRGKASWAGIPHDDVPLLLAQSRSQVQ